MKSKIKNFINAKIPTWLIVLLTTISFFEILFIISPKHFYQILKPINPPYYRSFANFILFSAPIIAPILEIYILEKLFKKFKRQKFLKGYILGFFISLALIFITIFQDHSNTPEIIKSLVFSPILLTADLLNIADTYSVGFKSGALLLLISTLFTLLILLPLLTGLITSTIHHFKTKPNA